MVESSSLSGITKKAADCGFFCESKEVKGKRRDENEGRGRVRTEDPPTGGDELVNRERAYALWVVNSLSGITKKAADCGFFCESKKRAEREVPTCYVGIAKSQVAGEQKSKGETRTPGGGRDQIIICSLILSESLYLIM